MQFEERIKLCIILYHFLFTNMNCNWCYMKCSQPSVCVDYRKVRWRRRLGRGRLNLLIRSKWWRGFNPSILWTLTRGTDESIRLFIKLCIRSNTFAVNYRYIRIQTCSLRELEFNNIIPAVVSLLTKHSSFLEIVEILIFAFCKLTIQKEQMHRRTAKGVPQPPQKKGRIYVWESYLYSRILHTYGGF